MIKIGDKLPNIDLLTMTPDGPNTVTASQLYDNQTVALFGVPGAFTPTCSAKHLPGFIKHANAIKNKGIDLIACVSVNDVYVMGAWAIDQNVIDEVLLLADGSAKFSNAVGLSIDSSERGMGVRCKRFLMIIDQGVLSSLKVDPPGKFEHTSAESLLSDLSK